MNILAAFIKQAQEHPNRPAIIDGRGNAISFGTLLKRSEAVAAAWSEKGVVPGDRLLLAMGLGIDLYVALAAAWRIGAVIVFPEPAMGLKGLRHAARVTAPKAYLSSGFYRLLGLALPELRAVPLRLTPADRGSDASVAVEDVSPDQHALISFTSGSTGEPKAIARSHAFLEAQNAAVASLLRPKTRREIDLVAFPVFVVANLALGLTSVLPNWNVRRHDTADAEALANHIARHGVTRALIPPSICERLLAARHTPSLSAIFTGGGPVFPSLMTRMRQGLPEADIVAVYGSTEAEPIAHLDLRDITPDDWTTMSAGGGLLTGLPVPEVSVKLIDSEIAVTGGHVNKGYLDPRQNAGNKVTIDGVVWHRTGDAGRFDDKGRLWLLGRHDARIGQLYPFPVEVSALSWPGVRRTALTSLDGRAILAIEGDQAWSNTWQQQATALGDIAVVPMPTIPLDHRHRSKVDYARLRHELNRLR